MKILPVVGRAPVLILWNFGHWCNMDCLHCYSRLSAHASDRDMTEAEALFLAEGFIKARVMQVHLGGGEPLGRADLLPIAKLLKNSGIRMTLSTNGWFLDNAMADEIAALPFAMVTFSVYGSDDSSHDSFTRRAGAWMRLVQAVNRLVERGIPTQLAMTLMRPTAQHSVKLLELAHQWGVTTVQFQTFKEYGNAQVHSGELRMNRGEWVGLYDQIRRSLPFPTGGPKVDLGLDSDPVFAEQIGLPSAHNDCMCGVYSLTVRPNGDVVACPFSAEIVGNLHHDDLLKLWQKSPVLIRIRRGGASPCSRERLPL